jgi:hypothetical protein
MVGLSSRLARVDKFCVKAFGGASSIYGGLELIKIVQSCGSCGCL